MESARPNERAIVLEDDTLGRLNLKPKIVIERSKQPDTTARFALSCIERWGMVAAMPDGEDTAGRTRLKLAEPSRVVHRAFTVAALAMDEIERRGWNIDLPSYEDAENIIRDRREKKDLDD